jgi:hypothetical protein
MTTKKIEIITRHQINFGTADKPNHKTKGDIVECDSKQADGLIESGYAKDVTPKTAKTKGETADEGK